MPREFRSLWPLAITLLGLAAPALGQVAQPKPREARDLGRVTRQLASPSVWAPRALAMAGFEPNHGQADPAIKFLAGHGPEALALTERGALLRPNGSSTAAQVELSFLGGAAHPELSAEEPAAATVSYFSARDPQGLLRGLPTSAAVRYRGLYPGTEVLFHRRNRALEYDVILQPGADPGRVRLGLKGARRLRLSAQGDLLVTTPAGTLRQQAPTLYQEADGVRVPVRGGFRLLPGHRFGFKVGRYDRSRPLIIDPSVSFETNLGNGYGSPTFKALTLDDAGNLYVAGTCPNGVISGTLATFDLDPVHAQSSARPGTVVKLDAQGALSTVWIFPDLDAITGIALGSASFGISKDIFIAGVAGTITPSATSQAGGFQPSIAGGRDGFLGRLYQGSTQHPNAPGWVYGTYLGGSGDDTITGLAVDSHDNAFVTGSTTSQDLPLPLPGPATTTLDSSYATLGPTPYPRRFAITHSPGTTDDGFVAKINPDGSALLALSFLGGDGDTDPSSLALDSNGDVYVTGTTSAYSGVPASGVDFPYDQILPQAPIPDPTIVRGFVTKLSGDLSTKQYSTLLAGSSDVDLTQIAVDGQRQAYLVGTSNSLDFFAGYPNTSNLSADPTSLPATLVDDAAFTAKLNTSGDQFAYRAFLGESISPTGIAVDSQGSAWLAGISFGDPVTLPADNVGSVVDPLSSGLGFLEKLSPDGAHLAVCTFVGASAGFAGRQGTVDAIGLTDAGQPVLAGSSLDSSVPQTVGWVLGLDVPAVQVDTPTPTNAIVTSGSNVTFQATVSNALDSSVKWSTSANARINASTGAVTVNNVGDVTVTATSQADPSQSSNTTLTVVAQPTYNSFSANQTSVAAGGSVDLSATFDDGSATSSSGSSTVTASISLVASNGTRTSLATSRTSPFLYSAGPLSADSTFELQIRNDATLVNPGDPSPDLSNPPTLTVTVIPPPVQVSNVTPANGKFTELSADNNFAATITGGTTGLLTWNSRPVAGSFNGGTWTAPAYNPIQEANSYLIIATSVDDPSQHASTHATVYRAPVATSLVPSDSNPPFGARVALTPTFTGGLGATWLLSGTARIGSGGLDSTQVSAAAGSGGTGLLSAAIVADTTFTLTVRNDAGSVASTTCTVRPQVVAVTGLANAASVTAGTQRTFTAQATGGVSNGITWSAHSGPPGSSGAAAGSFSGGTWTAPDLAGTYTVVASSADDARKTAECEVTVLAAPAAASLAPSSTAPAYGSAVTLTGQFSGGTATLTATPAGGSPVLLSSASVAPLLFTIAACTDTTPVLYTLTVTNPLGVTASTTCTVTAQTVAVSAISPAQLTLSAGSSLAFSASVTGAASDALIWTATGGQFNGNLWTAPELPGTYTITATSVLDPSKSASTGITISAAPITAELVADNGSPLLGAAVTLIPTFSGGVASLGSGGPGSADLGAAVQSGRGISVIPPIGSSAYTLTVTSPAGAIATAACLVTPQTVTVFALTPANPRLNPGASQAFSASVTGAASDALIWTATGGQFNGNLWTAPQTPGAYTITATSALDPNQSASTEAIVGGAAALTLDAALATLVPGDSLVVTVLSGEDVTWSLADAGTGSLEAIGPRQVRYRAPATGGVRRLSATSVADRNRSAEVTLQVLGPNFLDARVLLDLAPAIGTRDAREDVNDDGQVDDLDLAEVLHLIQGVAP